MTEIQHTNFTHMNERHEPSIEAGAQYTVFEPIADHINPDGKVERMLPNEVLRQVEDYAKQLGVKPDYLTPFGSGETQTVGEIIDTNASTFLEEQDQGAPSPEGMVGVLTTIARLAERSGFDRDKATFTGAFMYERVEGNPNRNIHSDGLSGIANEDTEKAKTVRFVYALGPGTILYPQIDKTGVPMNVDYDSATGIAPIETPTAFQSINSSRGAIFTEEELQAGGAQQVMPGKILGFDPTRTFWHQAPDAPRPILVIDVKQTS